jgi:hypothetical protein
VADRTENKPPRPAQPPGKPAEKKPPEKAPPRKPAPAAPEKTIIKKPAGIKGSFILVLIVSLLWGFMAGVSWGKLQGFYDQGYNSFSNTSLLLMLPFLLLFFSLSLFWLIRTPRRKEVKPLAVSSLLLWLIYFSWELVMAGRF